jgi:hypothetical protein
MIAFPVNNHPATVFGLIGGVLLFCSAAVAANPLTPIEIVKLFDTVYGGPEMDEIADYTTSGFRDNRPKAVWIVDPWRTMQKLKYEKLGSSIVLSKVKEDRAVVVLEVEINAKAGGVTRKEIFSLVKEDGKWLIDELFVTDEDIDGDKIQI